MFGSRNVVGAVIIPASAPSIAASPQPSASIQETRTPSSRLASGAVAAARSPSPTLVNWKSRESSATAGRGTALHADVLDREGDAADVDRPRRERARERLR